MTCCQIIISNGLTFFFSLFFSFAALQGGGGDSQEPEMKKARGPTAKPWHSACAAAHVVCNLEDGKFVEALASSSLWRNMWDYLEWKDRGRLDRTCKGIHDLLDSAIGVGRNETLGFRCPSKNGQPAKERHLRSSYALVGSEVVCDGVSFRQSLE